MKILIAEDDLSTQAMTGFLVKQWGYEYDIADNGLKAVELAETNQGKYDLCLMDIDMPIMNGCDAARMIRQKIRYLPILGLSSNIDLEYLYQEAGMDDFLEKSYVLDELHGKIKELTVKSVKVDIWENCLHIRKEMPMDQKHAEELKELKKHNLIKVKFDDISGSEVVIHKNIMNKIVEDFNVKKQFVSTFLNRNPDKPTKCVLFGNNCRMPQMYLDDEDYSEELRKEDEAVEKCTKMILKIEKDA